MGPFYTYVIFAADLPVYVGKGRGQRCLDHLREKRQLRHHKLRIEVEWAASEQAALERERELIQELAAGGTLLNKALNPMRASTQKLAALEPLSVHWGPWENPRFGHRRLDASRVAEYLMLEAARLSDRDDAGSAEWENDVFDWLMRHEYFEEQVPDWWDAFDTGYLRLLAARRRVDRERSSHGQTDGDDE